MNTIKINYNTILHYFYNKLNASAESFNAKIKAFRNQFRGVRKVDFFLFRLTKLLPTPSFFLLHFIAHSFRLDHRFCIDSL
jgi:hypothetical protein